ncbi:uncharacterized protein LOC133369648 [Rhineura floridana]|uniref:uncharacterized protein LOC133369648 n=1 Tax=Rhineura floridana TaxID=261503 RepID=UPI002AC7EBC5|nr:uncharacterized protein LOC133369648 [Rhineura floridana]
MPRKALAGPAEGDARRAAGHRAFCRHPRRPGAPTEKGSVQSLRALPAPAAKEGRELSLSLLPRLGWLCPPPPAMRRRKRPGLRCPASAPPPGSSRARSPGLRSENKPLPSPSCRGPAWSKRGAPRPTEAPAGTGSSSGGGGIFSSRLHRRAWRRRRSRWPCQKGRPLLKPGLEAELLFHFQLRAKQQ